MKVLPLREALPRCVRAVAGLSHERIAQVLVVGLVLGTFPVFGFPTVLCLMAAVFLKLNVVAVQMVNQVATPLQLLLLIPLAHAGSRIFGSPGSAHAPLVAQVGLALLHAVEGWFCVCVPLGLLLYAAILYGVRRRNDATLGTAVTRF